MNKTPSARYSFAVGLRWPWRRWEVGQLTEISPYPFSLSLSRDPTIFPVLGQKDQPALGRGVQGGATRKDDASASSNSVRSSPEDFFIIIFLSPGLHCICQTQRKRPALSAEKRTNGPLQAEGMYWDVLSPGSFFFLFESEL